MLETIRGLFPEDKCKLRTFASIDSLSEIVDNAPESDIEPYLNNKFRNFLKEKGTFFDIPFSRRMLGQLFEKNLLTRGAIMINQDPHNAFVVVVETDSLRSGFSRVVDGLPLPNDPETADILIWPVEMFRKNSEGEWNIALETQLDPQQSKYFVRLVRYGGDVADRVFAYKRVPGYRGLYNWAESSEKPMDLLKGWAGVRYK